MEKMQPEQVMADLREHGFDVTLEQTKEIMEHAYRVAEIIVEQLLQEEKEELQKNKLILIGNPNHFFE